jgi:vitamin B12 transporter
MQDKYNESLDFNYRGSTANGRWTWSARYTIGRDVDKNGYNPRGTTPSQIGPSTYNIIDSNIIQAQLTRDVALFRLSAGLDYVKYDRSSRTVPRESTYEDTAGYIMGKLRFLDEALIFSAGIRHDTYKVSLEDTNADGNATNRHVSPSLGVAYSPLEWLKIRVNWSEAFLMPEARQLAGDYNDSTGIHVTGNPNLKPEISNTFELGFDMANPHMSGSFTYFQSASTNKIVSQDIEGKPERTYINLDKAERKGMELEGLLNVGSLLDQSFDLSPYFNLTYMFKYIDKKTNKNLEYVPKIVFSYGVNFNYPSIGLSCTINVAYTGEQDIVIYPRTGSSYAGIHETYSVTDISLKKKLIEFDRFGDLDIKVDILNVFNKYYESVHNYPSPGRSFYVALQYNY